VCIFEAVAFGGRAGAHKGSSQSNCHSVVRTRARNKNDVVDVGSGYI
jgi:hypothetical protein